MYAFVRLVWVPGVVPAEKRLRSRVLLGDSEGIKTRSRCESNPKPNLLVVERREGPVYYAKWRAYGAQVKRRLGPAWIERGDAAKAERRRTRHDGWIKRRGRVGEGYLSEDDCPRTKPSR